MVSKETFLLDSGPCWFDCIVQFLPVFLAHIHASNLLFTTSHWIRIRCLGMSLKNTKLIVMFVKPV